MKVLRYTSPVSAGINGNITHNFFINFIVISIHTGNNVKVHSSNMSRSGNDSSRKYQRILLVLERSSL